MEFNSTNDAGTGPASAKLKSGNDALIRSNLIDLVGSDLLGDLDIYRIQGTAARFGRHPDNDGDGMSNEYELAKDFDPDWPLDADQDADKDGQRNGAEERAGTDPHNPSDFLRILEFDESGEEILISWPSVSGINYRVSWSTDLVTWIDSSDHPGNGSELSATIDKVVLPEESRVFLRVSIIESSPCPLLANSSSQLLSSWEPQPMNVPTLSS